MEKRERKFRRPGVKPGPAELDFKFVGCSGLTADSTPEAINDFIQYELGRHPGWTLAKDEIYFRPFGAYLILKREAI